MFEPDVPMLNVPRPALSLVERVGFARTDLSHQDFQAATERPDSTVNGYLRKLTQAQLVLHVGYDQYAIPRRTIFGSILVQPSAYLRSVLLYQDILTLREEPSWAFACLPIRRAYPMEISRAVPVIPPHERLMDRKNPPFPEVLWFGFDGRTVRNKPLSTHVGAGTELEPLDLTVPTLPPETSLALLMASLDPRYARAAREAAEALELPVEEVVERALHMHPEAPPVTRFHPNSVVFPEWLREFWETASQQHSRSFLKNLLHSEAETGPAEA